MININEAYFNFIKNICSSGVLWYTTMSFIHYFKILIINFYFMHTFTIFKYSDILLYSVPLQFKNPYFPLPRTTKYNAS